MLIPVEDIGEERRQIEDDILMFNEDHSSGTPLRTGNAGLNELQAQNGATSNQGQDPRQT